MAKGRRHSLYPGERDPVLTLAFVGAYFVAMVVMLAMLIARYLQLA